MDARAKLRVGALTMALAVLTALVAAPISWSIGQPWRQAELAALAGLVVLTVVSSIWSLVLRSGMHGQTVAPTEAMLVLGLLLGPPAALAVAVADVAGLVVRGLRSPVKIGFNLVQQLAALTCGVLVWQLLRGQAGPQEGRWALAALAAGTVCGLVSTGATFAAHRAVGAPRPPTAQLALALSVGPTATAFAVVTVALVGRDWRFVTVLAPLAIVIMVLIRTLHGAQRRASALTSLRGITVALAAAGDPQSVARRAIDLATELLGARHGELRIELPSGRQLRAATPARVAELSGTDVAQLLRQRDGRLLAPNTARRSLERPGGPAACLRRQLDVADAVAVTVCAPDEVAGWLLVADHQLSYTFDNVDLATLEALADALGVALLAADTASRLRVEATTDSLTGLANRRAFRASAEAVVADAGSVLIIDLDGFKSVNDTLGHAAGDEVLALLAERIATHAGPDAVVGRLGGDEFAVALPPAIDAPAIAARLRAALSRPAEVASGTVTLGASVGTASAPRDGTSLSELLAAADHAMYETRQDRHHWVS